MLKKWTAAVLALMLILTMCAALAGEIAPFSLDGRFFWGMNEAEILTALGNVRTEKEREWKLTYLEPDDYRFSFEGLNCEITFGLKEDSLVLIELDFADRVASRSVADALTALYGEGVAVTDPQEYAELEAMSDPDEIDLWDDDPQSFTLWTAEDGTKILMITDIREDEAKVVFYTVPTAE